MGSCVSTPPVTQQHNNQHQDNNQNKKQEQEYSVSPAEELEEKEIIIPEQVNFSSPHPSVLSPLQEINSPKSLLIEMTQKEVEQFNNIRNELKDIRQGLLKKISVLSQNQLSTDDTSQSTLNYSSEDIQIQQDPKNTKAQISQIIKTCKDVLYYSQQQQQELKVRETQKIEAEKKAIYFLEECNRWKETVATSKENMRKIKGQRDELVMKLDYYQQELNSVQNKMIEIEAQNLSYNQRIKDSETKMSLYKEIIDTLQSADIHNINISEIENKLKKTYQGIHGNDDSLKNEKLKKAATTLYDLIARNEEQKIEYESKIQQIKDEMTMVIESKLKFEDEMNDKLKIIQNKQREKNLALQTLVKKNNKYLLESQAKIKSLTDERDKLSENCMHWHRLCQQQSRMLKGFQDRKSDKTNAELDKYLRSQMSPMLSPDL